MADERDPQVSRRYRELGAEEPPRALDEAILAASRQGLKRKTWYGPVALAASLVLVVAVAVQVERQQPDEAVVATAPVQEAKEEKTELFSRQAEAPAGSGIKPERKRQSAASAPADSVGIRGSGPVASPASPPAQAAPPPRPAPSPNEEALRDLAKATEAPAPSARSDAAEARRMEREPQAEPAPAPAARASGTVSAMIASPESQLGTIAELRRLGRHEEADKALAEFRKRYPDYRLSDEMKAKVERK